MHADSINDELMDELASGTLSGERYRSLLLAIEAEPARWRDCALAFLREQAIAQELKTLAAGDIDWYLAEPPTVALPRDVMPRDYIDAAPIGAKPKKIALTGKLFALATVLLVGFSIGWLGSELRNGDADRLSVANRPVLLTSSDAKLPESQAAMQLAQKVPTAPITPGESTQAASTQFNPDARRPGVDSDLVRFVSDQFVPIDREVPSALRELERQGRVRIETFDAVMPIRLEDGTAAIVPVQQFHVVPTVFAF